MLSEEKLLGLVLSAIVVGTNVDIAEVSEMYMSDLPSPQPLDIEYDRWIIIIINLILI